MKENPGEIIIPYSEIEKIDVSDKHIEKMARGFILGTANHSKRKEIRENLETRVTQRIGKKGKYLVDKLFELIEGVYIVDKRGNEGSLKYYQVPPNLQAIIYALDRVLGKPKQQVDISEEKKGIILVEHVIRNLAANPYRKPEQKNDAEQRSSQIGVGAVSGTGAGAGGIGDAGSGGAAGSVSNVNEGVGQVVV